MEALYVIGSVFLLVVTIVTLSGGKSKRHFRLS